MKKWALLTGLLILLLAVPAKGQIPSLAACQRAAELPPLAPVNVELAAVTDSEFIVTWLTCSAGQPAPADTKVEYGLLDSPSAWQTISITPPTAYHYARVDGLKPGTRYGYRVSSNGIPGAVDRFNPGAFTTLTPPPGKELFSFAVFADMHLGEEVSGLATSSPGEFPPGYRSDEPYPATMAEAAVQGANDEGVDLTIVPADNSSHGELPDLQEARTILDSLEAPYVIARGAHDRPNQYEEAIIECPPDGDCFRVVFRRDLAPALEPQPAVQAKQRKGWVFIALDSANLSSGMGELPDQQLAWLEDQLKKAAKKERPAIVFFHHPVAEYSTTAAVPPVIFGVNQSDAQAFLELIGRYDVRLVINAHTHRNWIAYSPHTGRVPILEVGPTKEYPAGYSIFRVYEGGILRTWVPIKCEFCNAWRETTRGEYFALYPLYTTGSLRDRSFVHLFDGPDVPGVPSLPMGIWPPLLPGSA